MSGPLARSSLSSLVLRIAGIAIAFLTMVVLTRTLGPAEYGIYVLAISSFSLMATLSCFGREELLVREVAILQSNKFSERLKGIISWSISHGLIFSIFLPALLLVFWKIIYRDENIEILAAMSVGLIVIPILVQVRQGQAILRGLGKVSLSQIPLFHIIPIFVCCFVVVTAIWDSEELSSFFALSAYAVGSIIALILVAVSIRHFSCCDATTQPERADKAWFMGAGSFAIIAIITTASLELPPIMLGILSGPESVGLYAPAGRLAAMILLGQFAISMPLAPAISKLYAAQEFDTLQDRISKATIVLAVFSLLSAVFLILAGELILQLFGPLFTASYGALVILIVGNAISLPLVPMHLLLMMTNHERTVAVWSATALAASMVLYFTMIPRLGIEGAAVATSVGLVVARLPLAFHVWRRLKMRPFIFHFDQKGKAA